MDIVGHEAQFVIRYHEPVAMFEGPANILETACPMLQHRIPAELDVFVVFFKLLILIIEMDKIDRATGGYLSSTLKIRVAVSDLRRKMIEQFFGHIGATPVLSHHVRDCAGPAEY